MSHRLYYLTLKYVCDDFQPPGQKSLNELTCSAVGDLHGVGECGGGQGASPEGRALEMELHLPHMACRSGTAPPGGRPWKMQPLMTKTCIVSVGEIIPDASPVSPHAFVLRTDVSGRRKSLSTSTVVIPSSLSAALPVPEHTTFFTCITHMHRHACE